MRLRAAALLATALTVSGCFGWFEPDDPNVGVPLAGSPSQDAVEEPRASVTATAATPTATPTPSPTPAEEDRSSAARDPNAEGDDGSSQNAPEASPTPTPTPTATPSPTPTPSATPTPTPSPTPTPTPTPPPPPTTTVAYNHSQALNEGGTDLLVLPSGYRVLTVNVSVVGGNPGSTSRVVVSDPAGTAVASCTACEASVSAPAAGQWTIAYSGNSATVRVVIGVANDGPRAANVRAYVATFDYATATTSGADETQGFTVLPGFGTLEIMMTRAAPAGGGGLFPPSGSATVTLVDPTGAERMTCNFITNTQCSVAALSPAAAGRWVVEYGGAGADRVTVDVVAK